MNTLQTESLGTLEDRRPLLIQIAHRMARFTENQLVDEFAKTIHKTPDDKITKAVRRILRDEIEHGTFDLEKGEYFIRRRI